MKILYVINSFGMGGGAETLLIDFITTFKATFPDSEHHILTLKTNNNPLFNADDTSISSYQTLNLSHPKKAMLHGNKIKRLINKLKIDVVHSHLTYSTLYTRMYRPKSIPLVVTYHNMEYCKESPNYSKTFGLLDRFLYNSKNEFSIFVSSTVEKCLLSKINMKNYKTLPNFANNRFYFSYKNQRSPGTLKLVAVGGLKRVKNHTSLLKAMANINGEKNISLDIYGQGRFRDSLQAEIEQYGIKVQLKGLKFITSELLCQYDAFILPSFSEGMPISLIEAMVTGMPSLLSNLEQLKSVAKGSALYFDPNDIESIQNTIENLYSKSYNDLTIMSSRAKDLSIDLLADKYVKKMHSIYSNLIEQAI